MKNNKYYFCGFRCDNEINFKLKYLCDHFNLSISDLLRRLINTEYIYVLNDLETEDIKNDRC